MNPVTAFILGAGIAALVIAHIEAASEQHDRITVAKRVGYLTTYTKGGRS